MEDLIKRLASNNLTLSIVENSTGGKLTSKFIEVAGSSKVIKESHILYSNESKIKYLGLDPLLFKEYGAVSSKLVKEMALSLSKLSKTDITIAASEIVGPSGGSEFKPVGTSYVAINFKGEMHLYHEVFSGTRTKIQDQIVDYILMRLGELLNDY